MARFDSTYLENLQRCSLNYVVTVQGNITRSGGSVIQVEDFIGQYDGVVYNDYEAMMSVLPEGAKFAFQITVNVQCTISDETHEITDNATYTNFVVLDGAEGNSVQEISWRDAYVLRGLFSNAQYIYRVPYSESVGTIYVSNMQNLSFYIELPVTGKVWGRIKKFFGRVWRVVKNFVPKIAKVISPVLPGPYGAAVGAIGAAVSGVDTIIQAAATGSTNPNASIEGAVTVDDEDAFEITPQYCINTAGSEPKDILTSPDSEWVSMPAVRVKVNSPTAVTLRAKGKFSDNAELYARMRAYLSALTASGTSLEHPFQIQQRAKVVFIKGCTLEQAKNYSATLRLGSQV